MAIAALLVAVVPSSLEKLREVSQYRDTVRAMVVDLRQARQQAVVNGAPVIFRVNLADRQFGIEGQSFKKIPDSLEIKTTVGTSGASENTRHADITFMAEGGATGGTIELVRQSGAGVRLRVDWLFGLVTQEPRQP